MKFYVFTALLVVSSSAYAMDDCAFDYGGHLYAGFSKGQFDTKNIDKDKDYVTHNNASRVDGSISYSCNDTTVKYIYSSGWDLEGTQLKSNKLINAISINNDNFGSLIYGQLSTPYKLSGKAGDPFWDTAAGTVYAGNNFGFSSLTRGFSPDSLVYKSPNLKNIYIIAGYSGSNSKGDYHSGLEYKKDNRLIGIQYISIGDSPSIANGQSVDKAVRLYARNQFSSWKVSLSFEEVDKIIGKREQYLNISAERPIVNFGRIALSYGQVADAGFKLINGSTYYGDGHGYSIGTFYEATKNFEVYFIGSALRLDDNVDQDSLVLGLKYNFSF
ncbi:porin [Microbulbifer sp. SSSA002]|uniref:porin n=1 Tax=Microbulbifer sp. SSSA002 TaxID=3243376 RepID=UPI004039BBC0